MSYLASDENSPARQQLSPLLSASAVGLAAVGILTGLVSYLQRQPAAGAHDPGAAAWPQQLILAAAACALYGVARRRRGRRPDRGRGRLLVLAPLGRRAESRLAATMRQRSWRSAAALPPLALIGYSCWRIGDQVTAGLDPNFTANAWGGPTYLGAMACHDLDAGLIIAACASLLGRILLRPPRATPRYLRMRKLGQCSDIALLDSHGQRVEGADHVVHGQYCFAGREANDLVGHGRKHCVALQPG